MNNAEFEQLPDEAKFAVLMETACDMLGRETVEKQVALITPLVRDMIGHGNRTKVAGDASNPADNYWGGVWQVYDLE